MPADNRTYITVHDDLRSNRHRTPCNRPGPVSGVDCERFAGHPGRCHHASAVYIVGWDEDAIVKVGETCERRWEKFCARGARLIALTFFPRTQDAIALEARWHRALGAVSPPAFPTRALSTEYLGASGGGYTECFRIHPAVVAAVAGEVA